MGADSQHATYTRYYPEWIKCRDAVDGQFAIHAKAETYLPKLSGWSDDNYAAYRKRALFFGAASRTVEGLAGMVFRRDPQWKVPDSMKPWMDDVTSDGEDHEGFAKRATEEVLTTGGGGILTDFPEQELDEDGNPRPLTIAEAERSRKVPFLRLYPREAVANWRTARLPNGAWGLVLLILEEEYEEQSADDEFEYISETQYRVLDLDESGAYRQRIFRAEHSGTGSKPTVTTPATSTNGVKKAIDGWRVESEVVPTFNGKPLDYIPFTFVTPAGNTEKIQKPPLLDMIDVNIQHYQIGAGYYHGLFYVGLPQAYRTGVSEDEAEENSDIGPGIMWNFTNPEAKIDYLQVDATGFENLREEMKALEHRMAVLGARILAPSDKAGVESGAALSIRSNSENSVLASIAKSVGKAMEEALAIARDWMGFTGEISYVLNTDFVAESIDPQTLTALTAALQSGSISDVTYFEVLQKGEMIRSDRSIEEEREAITASAPPPGADGMGGPEDKTGRIGRGVDASDEAGQAS